jgi:branched-subunit amino acid aminotransferase/4-amino-4-deoxychorismate lyase
MAEPLVYLNGRFMPFSEAGLALHDAGFVSGATIVDNARTFRHRLFRWPDHLARFRRDCAACYVPLEVSDEQLTAIAEELVARNANLLPPGGELQLVTFATPGPLGFYRGESANSPPTLGMATYPLPFERYRRFFTEGATLAVAGFQASDSADTLPPSVKHRSRLMWHVAQKELRDPGTVFHCDDPGAVPVLLSHDGVGDTAIGGILVVSDGGVIAPEVGTVLDSVSVNVVYELCNSLRIPFNWAPLDMRGLVNPDLQRPPEFAAAYARVSEVLLAGTGFCLAGVRRFISMKHSRDYTWPGPVFRRLLGAWSELVGLDIAAQFTRS